MRDRDVEFPAFVAARGGSLLRFAYLLTGSEDGARAVLHVGLTELYAGWRRADKHALDAGVRAAMARAMAPRGTRRPGAVTPVDWSASGGSGAPADVESDDVELEALTANERARWELWTRIIRLPSRLRTVVVLRSHLGFTEAQAADCLGWTRRSVRDATTAALAALGGNGAEVDRAEDLERRVAEVLRERADDAEGWRPPDWVRPGASTGRRKRYAVAAVLVVALGASAIAWRMLGVPGHEGSSPAPSTLVQTVGTTATTVVSEQFKSPSQERRLANALALGQPLKFPLRIEQRGLRLFLLTPRGEAELPRTVSHVGWLSPVGDGWAFLEVGDAVATLYYVSSDLRVRRVLGDVSGVARRADGGALAVATGGDLGQNPNVAVRTTVATWSPGQETPVDGWTLNGSWTLVDWSSAGILLQARPGFSLDGSEHVGSDAIFHIYLVPGKAQPVPVTTWSGVSWLGPAFGPGNEGRFIASQPTGCLLAVFRSTTYKVRCGDGFAVLPQRVGHRWLVWTLGLSGEKAELVDPMTGSTHRVVSPNIFSAPLSTYRWYVEDDTHLVGEIPDTGTEDGQGVVFIRWDLGSGAVERVPLTHVVVAFPAGT